MIDFVDSSKKRRKREVNIDNVYNELIDDCDNTDCIDLKGLKVKN